MATSRDMSQVRALIEGWARAVHAGDMEGVLADHASDIVMFDVPPPNNGVKGIKGLSQDLAAILQMAEEGCSFRYRLA